MKTFSLLILIILAGLALGSCVKEIITYCPFCGKSSVKEISDYDQNTGITKIYYECTNSKCGKKFGVGQMAAVTGEVK